jgi:DNA-binding MarR family transcriptional regulator
VNMRLTLLGSGCFASFGRLIPFQPFIPFLAVKAARVFLDIKNGMNENFELKIAGPYGVIPIVLARDLYTAGNYKQLVFTLYLDARRKCKNGKWEFSVTDIARETGIDSRLVTRMAKAFVAAGILSSTGRTPKGSRKYELKHPYFERYLNGKLALKSEKVLCIECVAPNAHQAQHQPIESGLSVNGASDTSKGRCALNASLPSTGCTFGMHSVRTKISEKISEEDKGLSENQTSAKELVRITASKQQLAALSTKYLLAGRQKTEGSSKDTIAASSSSTILQSRKTGESSATVTTTAPYSIWNTSSSFGLAASPLLTVAADSSNTTTTPTTKTKPIAVMNPAPQGKEGR